MKVTVVSDYLHFSGFEDYMVAPGDAERITNDFLRGRYSMDLIRAVRMIRRLPRDERGVVMPGNTVRGMARSRLELLLRSADYPAAQRLQSRGRPSKVYTEIFNPERKSSKEVSCVKDLFGEASRNGGEEARASRVFFSDFILPNAEAEKYVVTTKKFLPRGGSIELEAVKKGATFEGYLLGDGLKPWEIGMLAFALGYGGNGLWKVRLLGMYKYSDRQYGRVTFRLDYPQLEPCYGDFMARCRDDIKPVEEDWK
ncbi:RAMP superfamily CRISPR-associated protein [Tardisphaera miroshnichenkoae]